MELLSGKVKAVHIIKMKTGEDILEAIERAVQEGGIQHATFVSAIGSMNSYKDVLENPDHISRKVLDSGLDAQTAFEIVSIDIADVSVAGVGQIANVGAKLEADRADADKIMRQAEAEGRKAMAIAAEQEMRARVQEMQAKVIEAQAEVPLAMAEAFRNGNLGVMDYYNMQNIMADTSMRESLAGGDEENQDKGK